MAKSKKSKGFRKYSSKKNQNEFPWKLALICGGIVVVLALGYVLFGSGLFSYDDGAPVKPRMADLFPDGDGTWMVGNLAKDGEDAHYHKLAELDGIEGYTADEVSNPDEPQGSFTFRPNDEENPVKTIYISYAPESYDTMVAYFAEKMGAIYPVFELTDLGLTTLGGVNAHIATYDSGLTYEDDANEPIYTRTALAYLEAVDGSSIVIFAFSDSLNTDALLPDVEPLMEAVELAAESLRLEPVE